MVTLQYESVDEYVRVRFRLRPGTPEVRGVLLTTPAAGDNRREDTATMVATVILEIQI